MCSSSAYLDGAGAICGEQQSVTDGSGHDLATCYRINGHAGDHDFQVEPVNHCDNCQRVSDDLRPLDFGRSGVWMVCGICLDKWAVAA